MVNTTAMDQMTRYYWGMLGARAAAAGATRTTSLRAWPPPARGSGGGEPSWEELAFARDAAGHLGGCVWPPRSYTCTFCRREFRSAQALGGHMNVHRRDRARLRQCASPDHDVIQEAPQQQQPTTFPSYISTIIKESKNKVVISIPAATPGRKEALESDEEEMIMADRRKRRRVDQQPEAVLPFFLRLPASCQSVEKNAKVPKVITSPSSSSSLQLAGRQEVDLELRLGSNPKVP